VPQVDGGGLGDNQGVEELRFAGALNRSTATALFLIESATPPFGAALPRAYKIEMKGSRNTSFADRLNAAANAKKAELERAARAKSAAGSPVAVEQRAARDAVRV
jgi:hypothetical protein